jgi:ABC-type glycerol-3-phosphate transport system permease component
MSVRTAPADAVTGPARVSVGEVARQIAVYTVVGIVALALALPFLWMVSTSLKSDPQVIAIPPLWIPSPIYWQNYVQLFTRPDIPLLLFASNSAVVVSLAVMGQVLASAMVGFAFGRLRWIGRDVCFALLLATMMLPGQVTIVPLFILFSKLGWLNTWLPLIVPAWTGGAYFSFLVRQFMLTLPRELDDAARIDGCNAWALFWRVILPLCKPVIAAVAVFSFQWHWNDFFHPLIYITKQELQLLPVGITYITTTVSAYTRITPWNLLMAASMLMTLPMIIVFFLAQRVFIEGVVFSGLKG